MKLSELFANCAWNVQYETAGNGVSYAFVENSNELYIYFQGSYETIDWFRNFFFFPTRKKPYKDMDISYKVHRGFLEAWKEVEDLVIDKITETEYQKVSEDTYEEVFKWKKVIVVGYSHGGALAGLCHECVWFWRPDLRKDGLEGYGFEAPRFYASCHVKKSLKERWEKFTVIRDNHDLVTHCPPKLFRFCHVGKMIKVHGDVKLGPDKWYIPKCIKSHFPQVVHDGLKKEENK